MTATIITPNPLESDSQYTRYYHYDIAFLELDALQDELYALRPLLWGLDRADWIRERVQMIEAEIAKRRYTTGQPVKAKLKPKRRLARGVKL